MDGNIPVTKDHSEQGQIEQTQGGRVTPLVILPGISSSQSEFRSLFQSAPGWIDCV